MKRLFLEADELGQWHKPHSIHELFFDHGMGLLLTLAHQHGYPFDVLTLKSMHSWAEYRLKVKGYDLLGMNVRSWRFIYAKRAAEIFKMVNPNGQVWVGGMHCTVAPQEMEAVPEFDIIVSREGEGTFLELLANGGSTEKMLTGSVGAYANMDSLPFIDRELWPKNGTAVWPLESSGGWTPGVRAATMLTGRSCPMHCLVGDTPVLMADLTWKAIKNISEGEQVMGLWKGKHGHIVKPARVKAVIPSHSEPVYKIETTAEDVIATEEHSWLSHSNHSRWRPTKRLRPGDKIRWVTPVYEGPDTGSLAYKRGYVAGAVAGDGCIGHYNRKPPRNPETQMHRFGLVGDDEMLDTVLAYGIELGFKVKEAPFNGGKIYRNVTRMLRACDKQTVDAIEQLEQEDSTDEQFRRGFLAGAFDADGAKDKYTIRFCNFDPALIKRFTSYLQGFGFEWTLDHKAGRLSGLHIIGGAGECIRFLGMTQPKVRHNAMVADVAMGRGFATVLNVVPLGDQIVYNLSTESETFIAAGLASHNCSFCYPAEKNHFGPVRRRSVGHTLAELNEINRRWGPISSVVYHDSEFLMHPKWLEEYIERYPRETPAWPFWASCRADMMEKWPDLVRALHRDCNWHCFSIGLESGSQRVLDIMNKETTVEQNYAAIDLVNQLTEEAQREGRRAPVIFANVMLAIPGEEPEDAFATMRMIGRIKRVIPSISWFSPYPGSVLGDKMIAEGRSLDAHKKYLRYPNEAKITGVDYRFYVELAQGRYDREVGFSVPELMRHQGSAGEALT